MRHLMLGLFVSSLMAAPVGAQAPNAQLTAPIQKFVDSFNKGDMAGAAATHAAGPDLNIIDEVAPYSWHGAKAFQEWSAALDADMKKSGLTDAMVALKPPTRTEMSGDQAYVVVPAVYSFKDHGVAKREVAQMTFALKKTGGAWLIQSWTWTGPKPQKVPATTKP